MKNLAPGTSYTEPFSVSSDPDATPTAAVYAGSTSLGAASVATDTGANAYIATVTLPSTGLTDGVLIRVKVSWDVDGTAYSGWLDVGVVNLYSVQAAAVLAAATDSPIRADMRLINGEPPEPLGYDPAKESSVQNVLTAVNGLDGPGAPTGPGGIPVVLPFTVNNEPVDGASVWITTDPEGTNQIAGVIYTDTFGNTKPAFTLEPGIFYVWVQKAGINFTNPHALQVLENGTYQWYTG